MTTLESENRIPLDESEIEEDLKELINNLQTIITKLLDGKYTPEQRTEVSEFVTDFLEGKTADIDTELLGLLFKGWFLDSVMRAPESGGRES